MFNNKEKIAMVIGGVGLIGTMIVGVYSYGKVKFYEGRISKTKELDPIIKTLRNELGELLNKEK